MAFVASTRNKLTAPKDKLNTRTAAGTSRAVLCTAAKTLIVHHREDTGLVPEFGFQSSNSRRNPLTTQESGVGCSSFADSA
jgi:hypothetical protein